MIVSHHQNSGHNQNISTANESFEIVAKFKYSGTTPTNQNDIRDEIKSRLNSGNAFFLSFIHSFQNPLSSCLMSKKLKIKIYKTVTSLVVLYGCETWSVILREKQRLRVSDDRVLGRPMETFCEHRNEPSVSIKKAGYFLTS
jgi:hypothetical protein